METTHSIAIPNKVFNAFGSLALRVATPSTRVGEFVRIGVTAYDYTLTYSDTFILIHYAQPKPEDMGNMFEGFYRYLTKAEFAALPAGDRGYHVFPGLDTLDSDSVCPFQHDRPFQHDPLKGSLLDSFINHTQQSKTGSVHVDPFHLTRALKAVSAICSVDGTECMTLTVQDGFGPILLVANSDGWMVRGLVMPRR